MFLSLSSSAISDLLLELPPHRIRGFVDLSEDLQALYVSLLPKVYAKYIDFHVPKTIDYEDIFILSEYNVSHPAVVLANQLKSRVVDDKVLPLQMTVGTPLTISLLIRYNKIADIYRLYGINYVLDLRSFLPSYYESLRFLRTAENIFEGVAKISKSSQYGEDIDWYEEVNKAALETQYGTLEDPYFLHIDTDLDLDSLALCDPTYIVPSKLILSLIGPTSEEFSLGYSGVNLPSTLAYTIGRCMAKRKVENDVIVSHWSSFPKQFWIATLYLPWKQYVNCLLQIIDTNSEFLTRALIYMPPGRLDRILRKLPVRDTRISFHGRISNIVAFTSNRPINSAILSKYFTELTVYPAQYVPYPSFLTDINNLFLLLQMSYNSADVKAISVYSHSLKDIKLTYTVYSETQETGIELIPEQVFGILIARNYLYAKGTPSPLLFETLGGIQIDITSPSVEHIFAAADLSHPRYKYYLGDGNLYMGVYSEAVLSGILILLRTMGIKSLYILPSSGLIPLGNVQKTVYNF